MTSDRPDYQTILPSLRASYDGDAAYREDSDIHLWKAAHRARILRCLQSESASSLLEIGAGVGRDSLYFQENGLDVTTTDLSPEMVARCRNKGLNAHVMDFLSLDFPAQSFDAVYAMNCLLHVPSKELLGVLHHIQTFLKSDGLFFFNRYGGEDQEGVREQDYTDPPRFFCHYSDERILSLVSEAFEVISFEQVNIGSGDPVRSHLQALILRSPGA